MATLVCPQAADSPERPSTPAPNECTEKHTSPEGAQRIPGMLCLFTLHPLWSKTGYGQRPVSLGNPLVGHPITQSPNHYAQLNPSAASREE